MGRNVGTFLDLEEIIYVLCSANEKFDKPFKEFQFVSSCTSFMFNANVCMGTKNMPSVEYSVVNLDGRIIVSAKEPNFEYNCNVLANEISNYLEAKKENQ